MSRRVRLADALPDALVVTALVLLVAANVVGVRALHASGPVPKATAEPAIRVAPSAIVRDVHEQRADVAAALRRRVVPTRKHARPDRPRVGVGQSADATTAPAATESTPTVAARTPPVPAAAGSPQTTPPTHAAPVPKAAPPPARSTPAPAPQTAPKPEPAPPTTFDQRGTTPGSDAPAVPFDDSGSDPGAPR